MLIKTVNKSQPEEPTHFRPEDLKMSVGDAARLQEAMHADLAPKRSPTADFKKARMRRVEVMRDPVHGTFGVAIEGGKFVCPMPPAFDPLRAEMALYDGKILVRQGGRTLRCDPMTGVTTDA